MEGRKKGGRGRRRKWDKRRGRGRGKGEGRKGRLKKKEKWEEVISEQTKEGKEGESCAFQTSLQPSQKYAGLEL